MTSDIIVRLKKSIGVNRFYRTITAQTISSWAQWQRYIVPLIIIGLYQWIVARVYIVYWSAIASSLILTIVNHICLFWNFNYLIDSIGCDFALSRISLISVITLEMIISFASLALVAHVHEIPKVNDVLVLLTFASYSGHVSLLFYCEYQMHSLEQQYSRWSKELKCLNQ